MVSHAYAFDRMLAALRGVEPLHCQTCRLDNPGPGHSADCPIGMALMVAYESMQRMPTHDCLSRLVVLGRGVDTGTVFRCAVCGRNYARCDYVLTCMD